MARNLRLQVMLNAVDRVTGPLKRMRQGAGQTGQAMRETRDQLQALQRQQSDVTSYRKANAALRTTTRAMRDARERNRQYTQALERQRETHAGIKSSLTVARREYDRFATELLNTKRPSDQLNASLERARIRLHSQQTEFDRSARAMREYTNRTRTAAEQVKRLTQNHATQTERIRGLKTRLDEAGISTDNLGRSARELRTKEERLNTALQQQKRHLSEVAAQQRRLTEARDRYQNGMARVSRAQGVGAGMLGTGMVQGYAASRLLTPGVAWAEQMSTLQAVGGFSADDERYQGLRQQSRDLGASTAFSANEVGAGQEFLMRAGLSSDAIKASMNDVLALALANNTELARAADIASNIGSSFKVDLEGEGEFARVADILSGTARRTNVNLEMLGETFKYLGNLEGLDISLEQAAAMTGLMGNIGIQGSQAGTAVRALGNRLTKPTAAAAGLMEQYGIEVANAEGGMRDIEKILNDAFQATKDLGNVQRAAIFQEIFGVEAGAGISEIINQQGAGGLTELLEELRNNAGENAEMARVMSDNIGGDLKELQSAWAEIGIAITDTNEGPLRELVQRITSITVAVGDWIKANPELAGTIAKVAAGMIALATVGGAVTMTFAGILGPLLFTRFAITALGIKATWLATPLKAAGGALLAVGKAITVGLLGALKATAIFLATNPIGWAILAIAATALVIYKYWEPIKAFFSGLWQQVKDAFSEGIGGVARLLLNWSPYGLIYNAIISTVERLGISVPEKFSDFGSMIVDGIIDGITGKIGELRNYVTGLASDIAGWMGDTVSGAVDVGKDISRGLGDGIESATGWARGAINRLTGGAEDEARERLDTHSPSRVFRSIGVDVAKGLANGIEGDSDGPLKQVRILANNLRNAAGGLILGAGLSTSAVADIDTTGVQIDARPPLQSHAGSQPISVTINLGGLTVNAAPAMDEQTLARLVGEEIDRRMRLAEQRLAAAARRNLYDND
ncbi:phage tail tape measure protein [Vreelandella nanhaiensis]|uniref:Phage tail tape measure protein n=1 Tax=Vreelandella nanhaiensis TaxID=1258546 RepID=A0A3S0Y1J3_9GAMM|nr:phage tail tape measure protein [Halomonas nanhaiensis]RUR27707.1 phage tail tape measure protein [Halomonas nanhaiensis]